MNAVDLFIVAVLTLSVLVGLWRGLISEVLALAVWICAFWMAWTYGPEVSMHLEHAIQAPMLRLWMGYGLCFIAVLFLGALLRFALKALADRTGMGGTDRLLGMFFGFARGLLLVTLAVFVVSQTRLAREPMWQQSTLLPQFNGMAAWLESEMPSNVREHLHPQSFSMRMPNVLAQGMPASGATSPAAASSAADPSHHHNE